MRLSKTVLVIAAVATAAASAVFLFRIVGSGTNVPPPSSPRQEDRIVAENASLPMPGPVDNGLCLRLTIAGSADRPEAHTVRVDCLNTTDTPVMLVGEWGDDFETDYAEYFQTILRFTSYPQTEPFGCQSNMGGYGRSLPQPTTTIRPGEAFTLTYEATDRSVDPPHRCSSEVGLRSPGLYYVRAHATVLRSDGVRARLWSNEHEYVVGGDRRKPKVQVARIAERGTDPDLVTLDVGGADGVEEGDRYGYRASMLLSPQFEVVEVQEKSCKARRLPLDRAASRPSPEVESHIMPKDTKLELVPKWF
jgi:hypothetical protein